MALDWVSSIIQIVLVNAVLSGDNAMVIALAAHRLPAAQRRQAMLWGSGLAIVMRLLLTSPCRSWRCDGPGTDRTGSQPKTPQPSNDCRQSDRLASQGRIW